LLAARALIQPESPQRYELSVMTLAVAGACSACLAIGSAFSIQSPARVRISNL
jgi:hypothetical protein